MGSVAGATLAEYHRLVGSVVGGHSRSVSRDQLHHLVEQAVDASDRRAGASTLKPGQYSPGQTIQRKALGHGRHCWRQNQLDKNHWRTATRADSEWQERSDYSNPWVSIRPLATRRLLSKVIPLIIGVPTALKAISKPGIAWRSMRSPFPVAPRGVFAVFGI